MKLTNKQLRQIIKEELEAVLEEIEELEEDEELEEAFMAGDEVQVGGPIGDKHLKGTTGAVRKPKKAPRKIAKKPTAGIDWAALRAADRAERDAEFRRQKAERDDPRRRSARRDLPSPSEPKTHYGRRGIDPNRPIITRGRG